MPLVGAAMTSSSRSSRPWTPGLLRPRRRQAAGGETGRGVRGDRGRWCAARASVVPTLLWLAARCAPSRRLSGRADAGGAQYCLDVSLDLTLRTVQANRKSASSLVVGWRWWRSGDGRRDAAVIAVPDQRPQRSRERHCRRADRNMPRQKRGDSSFAKWRGRRIASGATRLRDDGGTIRRGAVELKVAATCAERRKLSQARHRPGGGEVPRGDAARVACLTTTMSGELADSARGGARWRR